MASIERTFPEVVHKIHRSQKEQKALLRRSRAWTLLQSHLISKIAKQELIRRDAAHKWTLRNIIHSLLLCLAHSEGGVGLHRSFFVL